MFKVKITIIGASETGKTIISNFLSEATETFGSDYHPTQGCRILEFEANNIPVSGGRNVTAEVELWDCSGDRKFESCWPALARDVNGVILAYNPERSKTAQELETWYSYFVERQGLRDNQCVIFGHFQGSAALKSSVALDESLRKIRHVNTNIDEGGEKLRDEFNSFLSALLATVSDRNEQEEQNIMNE